MAVYKIYSDGSCSNNGAKDAVGGWAYLILKDNKELVRNAGKEINTTNNRMELEAALRGLKRLEEFELNGFDKVELYTDSAYIHNCYKNKWYLNWQKNNWITASKTPVLNQELWKELIPYFNNQFITFNKVKGHAGETYNEIVDKMAVEVRNI